MLHHVDHCIYAFDCEDGLFKSADEKLHSLSIDLAWHRVSQDSINMGSVFINLRGILLFCRETEQFWCKVKLPGRVKKTLFNDILLSFHLIVEIISLRNFIRSAPSHHAIERSLFFFILFVDAFGFCMLFFESSFADLQVDFLLLDGAFILFLISTYLLVKEEEFFGSLGCK